MNFEAVEIELRNARRARIDAERACCDIEELAQEIRRSQGAFMRLISAQRQFRLH